MRRREVNVIAIGQYGGRTKDEPFPDSRSLVDLALTSKVSLLARQRAHTVGQEPPAT